MSDDELGSIGYLAAEFPSGRITEEDAAILRDAVNRRIIRVLDLEFLTKDPDGSMRKGELDELELENPDGVDLAVWSGAYSGCWTTPTWPRLVARSSRGAWQGS
jgi:hypothetical protein